QWWLPVFNQMFVYVDVQANYLSDPPLLIFLGCMLVGTSLLAGGYPAFYVSRFNASSIFRGSVKFGGSNLFSRLLLGLQVAIALITVIAGVGFSKNSAFQRTYDYGYDRENVMAVSIYDENSFNAFRNEIRHLPGVEATAGTRWHIGFSYRQQTAEVQGEKRETNFFEVGEGYLDVMNLKIAAGRAFDPNLETDFENALLVSENFAGQFGWQAEEALGKQVHIDTINYTVVGTLKDFHSDNLFDPKEPVAMRLGRPARFQDLVIRAKPGELTSTFDQAKAAWTKLFPLKPFRGFYQNEVAAESQRVTSSIARIFFWFAIISVLLTATGLFALVSLTVLKRMKEIAVRKVVGATAGHILVLVNKGYVWIFLAGAALGCYGGWSLTKLLMDMIFKINVGVGMDALAISAGVVLGVAALTVGAKVWTAVRTNPAEVLKGE
ncbi:MAG: ABC transporter permease, partial [Bacteroidota bacterium]